MVESLHQQLDTAKERLAESEGLAADLANRLGERVIRRVSAPCSLGSTGGI